MCFLNMLLEIILTMAMITLAAATMPTLTVCVNEPMAVEVSCSAETLVFGAVLPVTVETSLLVVVGRHI